MALRSNSESVRYVSEDFYILCFAAFVGLVFGCPSPQMGWTATAYYVDSLSGSDANLGSSPEKAWKTLTKLNATTFSPGDRILFKSGGQWTGQLWPKGSGTERHPIVIDKYGGEAKPMINGNGEAEDAVLLKNQEYWEVNNLEVTNTGSTPGTRRGMRLVADNYGDVHHIYVRGLNVHDVNGSDQIKENGGITYNCAGDSKPSRLLPSRRSTT